MMRLALVVVTCVLGLGAACFALSGSLDSRAYGSDGPGLIVFQREQDDPVSGHPYASYIYVARADGTGLRKLRGGRSLDSDPTWSPDGKEIAFVRTPEHGRSGIYVMNVDGSRMRYLGGTQDALDPSWSPDGKTIAFGCHDTAAICVVNGDGTHSRTLIHGVGNDSYSNPMWSPDSKRIAF